MKQRASETTILLLENDDNDVFFFRRALNALGYEGRLQVLTSIAKARSYIEGRGNFADRSRHPLPDLIVSDSRLADGTGVEFFHWLHAQPGSAEVPFVLFTSAAPPAVGVALVNAGARAFITKPMTFPETKRSVEDILEFLPQPELSGAQRSP
jgi:CheY-like chemotaxis protein